MSLKSKGTASLAEVENEAILEDSDEGSSKASDYKKSKKKTQDDSAKNEKSAPV